MASQWAVRAVGSVCVLVLTISMVLIEGRSQQVGGSDDTEVAESAAYPAAASSRPRIAKPERNLTTEEVVEPSVTSPPIPFDPSELDGLEFTDVTVESGLGAPQSAGPSDSSEAVMGGASVGDYDNDGDLDVVLPRVELPTLLYNNDGSGRFIEVATFAAVEGPSEGSSAAYFVDVDGDGNLDLFFTGYSDGGRRLYHNEGDGTFTDVTSGSGVGWEAGGDRNPVSASFADADGDSDLDLVTAEWFSPVEPEVPVVDGGSAGATMCDRPSPMQTDRRAGSDQHSHESASQLFRQDPDGDFVDVSAQSGIAFDEIAGFTPTFTDIDGDRQLDLLITGDYCTSRAYRSEGPGRYVDITEEAGLGDDENGMGSVVEDIDGDGNLDWFISAISYPTIDGSCPVGNLSAGCSGNRLYLGDGRGQYQDATDLFAVRDGFWGWGAAAQDFNNDGYRDLALANGLTYSNRDSLSDTENSLIGRSEAVPVKLWLGRPTPPWPEVGVQVGLSDTGEGKALVPFDMDGDGDLDILVVNTAAPPVLYRNDTPLGAHWLRLRLRQDGPNTRAIGARVVVHRGNGFAPMPVEVRAGGSLYGSAPTDVHVGLGEIGAVERIEIYWPGESEPQALTNVAADQILEIRRGS